MVVLLPARSQATEPHGTAHPPEQVVPFNDDDG